MADREAKFIVPVDKKGRWAWYQETTPENATEYQWKVSVRNGAKQYDFGFYLFRPSGAPPQGGDLAALLAAGQSSLFEEDSSNGANLIPGAGVSVAAAGDTVTIRIEGRENVRRLFSSHPQEVTFNFKVPGEIETKKDVKISYRH